MAKQNVKKNMGDPKLVESTCMAGEPDGVEPCIEGLVGVFVFHEAAMEPARELCGRPEPANRQGCYDSVESKADLFRS